MKIERNSPCPCGSGKKYKKCCLIRDQENEEDEDDRIGEQNLKEYEEELQVRLAEYAKQKQEHANVTR